MATFRISRSGFMSVLYPCRPNVVSVVDIVVWTANSKGRVTPSCLRIASRTPTSRLRPSPATASLWSSTSFDTSPQALSIRTHTNSPSLCRSYSTANLRGKAHDDTDVALRRPTPTPLFCPHIGGTRLPVGGFFGHGSFRDEGGSNHDKVEGCPEL